MTVHKEMPLYGERLTHRMSHGTSSDGRELWIRMLAHSLGLSLMPGDPVRDTVGCVSRPKPSCPLQTDLRDYTSSKTHREFAPLKMTIFADYEFLSEGSPLKNIFK